MAVVAYLLTRSNRGGNQTVDGIQSMILAIDDAVDTTQAAIRARGVTVANANNIALTPGYFDVSTAISTFDAAGDRAVFGELKSQVIA